MAPNFTPFTGFSYRDGLASLGQGLGRIHDTMQAEQERQLLEEWGKNPTMQNAARTRNPAAIAASLKVDEQRRTDARTTQATQAGLSALGLGGGLGGGSSSEGGFPASLINNESGGNWGASNDAPGSGGVGHFGRLQFSRGRLQAAMDAGAIPQGTTPEAFMRSPEIQQAAERWHFGDIDNFIKAQGLDRAIGRTINGVPVTLDGMRAVAHLGGNGGLLRFIGSGGAYNPSDRNGTSLMDYFGRHGGGGASQVASAQPQAQPVQVASADQTSGFGIGPVSDPAAADAARVQAQGGPRMVLSPQNPLNPGGEAPTQGGARPAMSAQRIAGSGTSAPEPFVPPGSVVSTPAGATEDDITQAEIASGMRTPEGGFLPAGSLSSSDAPAGQGTPLPYRQAAQPGSAQARPRSPNAPNWQTVDQVPQAVHDSFARERNIDKLTVVMANPYTPDGLRKVAEMRLATLLNENDKLPESVKTYKWARANNQHGGLSYQEFTDRNAKSNDPGEKLKTETAAREAEASRLGLDPRSPEGQRFILTGQMAAPQVPLTSSDRKAIFEAEDKVPMLDQTIETLQRARDLNRQTYTGTSAAARGWLGTSLPDGIVPDIIADPRTAAATREFGNIMSMEAIRSMSESLKGATTDREMSRFMEILGDPSTPPDIRERTIDRIMTLAQRQKKLAEDRIRDLRGGDYFKPGRSQGSGAQPDTRGPQASAVSSAIPTGAVEMLRSDPSLATQFDQKYGAGAARQVLGQ